MASLTAPLPTRLIICVDGTARPPHSETTISRISHSVRNGPCADVTTGVVYNQITKYLPGIGAADDVLSKDRLQAGLLNQGYQKQIQDVYELCCALEGHRDEVWLFGFSRGAYVVRAVAGLLHHFGAVASAGQNEFAKDFKKVLKQADRMNSSSPGLALEEIRTSSSAGLRVPPRIQFVGAFDTIKPGSEGFDLSLVHSILHLRHAVAIHEDRKALAPELLFPEDFYGTRLVDSGRSFVQSWFIGSHVDLGGAAQKAGLGLYALQWMLLEAKSVGLNIDFEDPTLSMVFPKQETPTQNAGLWSCTTQNKITVSMQDLRAIHENPRFRDMFAIKINLPGRQTSLRVKKQREAFATDGTLFGYCDHAPQGTIIHPSVYMLLDEHLNVALESKELKLQRNVEDWREKMLGTKNGVVELGFWNGEGEDDEIDPGAIRVLVCGNTGVGKSTLINKTFGVDVTQSSDRARGIHDVREEITFEGRPDLILHDSGGFEAGTSAEFEAIEEFLKDKSAATDIKDKLHIIWFCIDINSARTLQTATEKLFQAVSLYASDVPIVVVTTKKDDFVDLEFSAKRKELKKAGMPFDEELCETYAEEKLHERVQTIKAEMESVPGGRLDAIVAVSSDDPTSIGNLSKTTSRCFDTDKVRLLYIRAQVTRIDLKVDAALAEILRRYKRLIRSASGCSFAPMGSTFNRKSQLKNICKAIINVFGLPSVSADSALEALRANVWNTVGADSMLALAESLHTLAYIGSGFVMGAPIYAITGSINVVLLVPATARLFLTFACDLTLVLARSFKEITFRASGQPTVKDVQAAARNYQILGYARHIHRSIKKILPRRNVHACFRTAKVGEGVESLIHRYKDRLMEDVGLPLDLKDLKLDDDDFDDASTEADSTLLSDCREAEAQMAELNGEAARAELDPRNRPSELPAGPLAAELPADSRPVVELDAKSTMVSLHELEGDEIDCKTTLDRKR